MKKRKTIRINTIELMVAKIKKSRSYRRLDPAAAARLNGHFSPVAKRPKAIVQDDYYEEQLVNPDIAQLEADKLRKADNDRRSRENAQKSKDDALRLLASHSTFRDSFISSYNTASHFCHRPDCREAASCFCAECCSCIESCPGLGYLLICVLDFRWCKEHAVSHHQAFKLPHVLCTVRSDRKGEPCGEFNGEIEAVEYVLHLESTLRFPDCEYTEGEMGEMEVQCWTMHGPVRVRLTAPVCTCHRSNDRSNENEKSLIFSFLSLKIFVVLNKTGKITTVF